MTSIKELQKEYEEFKRKRDWEKFHYPKNIAMSISIEASELMELFQWKDNISIEKVRQNEELMSKVKDELADVILYSLSMAQRLDINLEEIVEEKLKRNKERFDEDTAEEIRQNLEEWTR